MQNNKNGRNLNTSNASNHKAYDQMADAQNTAYFEAIKKDNENKAYNQMAQDEFNAPPQQNRAYDYMSDEQYNAQYQQNEIYDYMADGQSNAQYRQAVSPPPRSGFGQSKPTANAQQRMTNTGQRTASAQQRVPNTQQRTANSGQRMANSGQRAANSQNPQQRVVRTNSQQSPANAGQRVIRRTSQTSGAPQNMQVGQSSPHLNNSEYNIQNNIQNAIHQKEQENYVRQSKQASLQNANRSYAQKRHAAEELYNNDFFDDENELNSAKSRKKPRKKKKSAGKIILSLLLTLLIIAGGVLAVGYLYANSVVNEGEMGSVAEEIKTPPQLAQDQLSILVVGIDNTEFDAEGAEVDRSEIGNTDMIMYVRFDFVTNSMYMLQIPRDLFVGEEYDTGGTGKLNALFSQGVGDDESRIDNLAVPISEMLQLPIDGYVTIDMISLREIVDVFGGIEVYVEQEMGYEGSSHIPQGWQTLHGDMLEFFLRDRSSPTGDIARLDNQRYFYSALFRRIRTATWQDIVKLMPVAQQYVNTDISVIDAAALTIKVLGIPSSNIMMCTLPTYDSTERYNGIHAVQVANFQGTADLLNTYFRTPETQVSVEEYNLADWPHSQTSHEPNVQFMSDVDAEGGGSVGVAADDVQTGDDLLQTDNSETLPVEGEVTQ